MQRPVYPAKFFVLVRGDLSPGMQIAQAVHAAAEYALVHPDHVREVRNLVVLNVLDENDLLDYATIHPEIGVLFREEDLDDEATAYATVCDDGRFQGLPLAGRELVRME